MARAHRLEVSGAFYHVLNRGRSRTRIFQDDLDRRLFLTTLSDTIDFGGMRVHAYVLMPNHYHLLVQITEPNLSRSMRHLGGVYTQRYHLRHGTDGSLFRGRFRSFLVQRDPYLLEATRYIHRNPVRAEMVETPEAFPWCSHRAYLGLHPPPSWLTVDSVLSLFSSSLDEARRRFHRFVLKEVPESVSRLYETPPPGPRIIGSETFRDRTLTEVSWARAVDSPVSYERIVKAIGMTFQISQEELLESGRGSGNWHREALVLIARREGKLSVQEIARRLGISRSGVSNLDRKGLLHWQRLKEFRALVESARQDLATGSGDQQR